MTFYQQLANHDRVVDAIRKGSESQSWTIKGTQGGTPFTFSHSDRFTSSYDISFDASYELADLVYLLSSVEGVDLDSVAVDGDVTNSSATYTVAGNEQLVKGEWKKVNNRNPATVRGGRQAPAARGAARQRRHHREGPLLVQDPEAGGRSNRARSS